MQKYFLIGIVIIGGILFIGSLFWKKIDVLLNLLLRLVFGILGIYIINKCFEYGQVPIRAGINEITILLVTFLGIPGFLLIYAIPLYFYLIK